jgi:peptide/histidine transporter 3/4
MCPHVGAALHSKVIVPVLRGFSSSGGDGEPSQLQRMGAGRLLMALAMAISALVEMKWLNSAAHGEITIAWQLPLYFFLAGACSALLLHRAGGVLTFYARALDSMKSTCTSLALLTMS